MARFENIEAEVSRAQSLFRDTLFESLSGGALSREQYVRFLSVEYHLTKGVQRYFMSIAASEKLAKRRKLREFLVRFSNEEELHYLVAANDLHKMGEMPLAAPLDVLLWHVYFQRTVESRPFVRLGAAVILENISGGVARPLVKQALNAPFLNMDNTKFVVLHQHEILPHGDQMLEAVSTNNLSAEELDDVVEGAQTGTVMYLRLVEWALRDDSLAHLVRPANFQFDGAEAHKVRGFEMADLGL